MAAKFTELEWSELLVAAVFHGLFWRGDPRVAAELRLRVAKFGVTPDDRARLRVELVDDEPAPPKAPARVLRLTGDG